MRAAYKRYKKEQQGPLRIAPVRAQPRERSLCYLLSGGKARIKAFINVREGGLLSTKGVIEKIRKATELGEARMTSREELNAKGLKSYGM